MELKFEGIEMWKWNIPTDRTQKVDEKNVIICLSCLILSYGHENVKSDSAFIFSTDDSKVSVTVWAKYLRASERSYSVLSENVMDCWTLMVISKTSTLENAIFFISTLNISQTATPKHTIFWKNSERSFICTCPNCDYFLLPSAENTKNQPFWKF